MDNTRTTKSCKVCSREFSCPLRQNGTQYQISLATWEKRRFCSRVCIMRGSDVRDKISKSKLGYTRTLESRFKQSETTKGRIRNPFTNEWKANLSKAHLGIPSWSKGLTGFEIWGNKENHPRWIEDRTTLQKYGDANKDRRSSAYADWRKQVWERDSWKCKIANADCSGRLEAHHILGWTEYVELRYEVNNGITLCHAHHPRKRAEEKRLSPYFQELVSVSKKQF